MSTPDDKESSRLPLNDQESAKLALAEAAKKVSDLKAKQWEIAKNAVVILAFLAVVFHEDSKYVSLQITNHPALVVLIKFVVLALFLGVFSAIFRQAFSNTERYKTIYKKAAWTLHSDYAKKFYFDDKVEELVEDEGRLHWSLFAVVVIFAVLVVFQIVSPPKSVPHACPCTHTSLHIVPHADSTTAPTRPVPA
jgi:Fe2+ transport system protein B